MSEMVHESGKLVPIQFPKDNLTIYEMATHIDSLGIDIDMTDSVEYDCITGRGVVTIQGVVYKIKDLVEGSPDDGYCTVSPQDDGTILFDTVYYKGSSFLEEQLEHAFEELDYV